jgi:membrane associated rhomboid family serine protease
MQSPFGDLRIQFAQAGSLYRILLINIVLFLLLMFSKTFVFLFRGDAGWLETIVLQLSLPAAPEELLKQPWSLITYMFLHWEFLHILFNMLILYWTGRLFIEYLGNDKFWATYILGGISGALFYLAAYNFFPVFTDMTGGSRLMGASAGVIAILVAIATLVPDYLVHLLIFGAVRLKYIALIAVIVYTIRIPDGNAGGELSHLGGALFGFVMIKQLRRGRDLTGWLTGLFSRKGRARKVPMEVVSRKSRRSEEERYKASQQATQEAIDRILDKINKSGFDSLTREEKEILYKASNKS